MDECFLKSKNGITINLTEVPKDIDYVLEVSFK